MQMEERLQIIDVAKFQNETSLKWRDSWLENAHIEHYSDSGRECFWHHEKCYKFCNPIRVAEFSNPLCHLVTFSWSPSMAKHSYKTYWSLFHFRIRIQNIQYHRLMCCGSKEDWEVIISTHLVVVIDMKLIKDSTRKLFLANWFSQQSRTSRFI